MHCVVQCPTWFSFCQPNLAVQSWSSVPPPLCGRRQCIHYTAVPTRLNKENRRLHLDTSTISLWAMLTSMFSSSCQDQNGASDICCTMLEDEHLGDS
jgi:hypothetical protein